MNYGLIGEHLTHSFSREIHKRLADYVYELCEIAPDNLDAFLKTCNFSAINVTIPYKKDVIPHLSWISEQAKAIGAVNTVVNRDGQLFGYNTDFYGLRALIHKIGIDLKDKKVLILGTGGTAATAFAVARDGGAKAIYKVSRTAKDGALSYTDVLQHHTDADVLINTTPCGMYPNGGKPIDLEPFSHLCGVVDAIYNPLCTPLILDAKKRGIPAAGGLYMLVMQAVWAVEIFLDCEIPADKADAVYSDILHEKENIVLIGMPACGKSTAGKQVAKTLNRPFVDLDEEIVKRAEKPIPQIFAEEGEPAFRDLEAEVVAAISKQNGLVIATGGGAILRQENVAALKSNGRLFWLNRPLEDLRPTADRPTAGSLDAMKQRYKEREPLYRAAADAIIPSQKTPAQTATLVCEAFLQNGEHLCK